MIYEGFDAAGAIRMWESYLEAVPDLPGNLREKELIAGRIENLKKKQ